MCSDVEEQQLETLRAALGPTLVASLTGGPGPENTARITTAHGVLQQIIESDDVDLARLWFTGANPWLGDDTPIFALRKDRLVEVQAAAQALVDDSFSG